MTQGTRERPEWGSVIEEQIGEDPTRFLIGELDVIGETIKARIRGIEEIAVARAWIAAERRLAGRRRVIDRLEDRIKELEERGERDLGERKPAPPKEMVWIRDGERLEERPLGAEAKIAKIREEAQS